MVRIDSIGVAAPNIGNCTAGNIHRILPYIPPGIAADDTLDDGFPRCCFFDINVIANGIVPVRPRLEIPAGIKRIGAGDAAGYFVQGTIGYVHSIIIGVTGFFFQMDTVCIPPYGLRGSRCAADVADGHRIMQYFPGLIEAAVYALGESQVTGRNGIICNAAGRCIAAIDIVIGTFISCCGIGLCCLLVCTGANIDGIPSNGGSAGI